MNAEQIKEMEEQVLGILDNNYNPIKEAQKALDAALGSMSQPNPAKHMGDLCDAMNAIHNAMKITQWASEVFIEPIKTEAQRIA